MNGGVPGAARWLSFFMGFLSLSQEILWVRMAGFIYHGAPQAFGAILALYLLGIALGACWGKRYCAREGNLFRVAAVILLVAAVMDWLFPWLVVMAFGVQRGVGTAVLMLCVLVTALLKSMVFPIAHHLGSSASAANVGSSVSRVYFANIAGSTLGPLVTGFIVLQLCTLQQSLALMAGATLMVSAFCLHAGGGRLALPALAAATLVAAVTVAAIPDVWLGRLVAAMGTGGHAFKGAVENRYGIVHWLDGGADGDIVYGGNAYDGRINTDYMVDSNLISRVYLLAAVQPRPRRVLVLGMSGGSWTRVLANFPGVEHIDVLEINPGYVDVIRRYDAVRPILADPRIVLHVDDGRRWLKRHPDEQYDLLVMNTTFHFRAYVTMLLSDDFLRMARSHLRPGGVIAFNSTDAPDVYKTAAGVFRHVYKLRNFVVAGDTLALPDEEEAVRRVGALVDTGQPDVQARVREDYRRFERYDEAVFARRAGRRLSTITDQNMLTEFRYGDSLLDNLGWAPRH
ncbi:methyltransferase domain-containing protein [Duganella sp. FT92W]|uniref:Methyltransferase domain-containing protein n=1 Tax=Pseudoduganella rivuli TaxID=2666085 RepID=A0A7X2LXY2_9BURK|nr:methyltransferase domain-containing protein [Pseudoduganella rivuli]MRV76409.1 methyltransferase domain-containing protein [Pseudoduganella rivuli]